MLSQPRRTQEARPAAALHLSFNHLLILAAVLEHSSKMRAKWRKKRVRRLKRKRRKMRARR
ncbi:hypothetical protein BDV28DRAFT_146078 [Aspergillus coremiiformis]|uniref:60S ribosomal protein L41 n=1 Tax=Aspergillus coremiiformis TaxID=138285 RepID=A0A5N6ZDR6_9EURO|nr:hypothetical protein BDV28DRAFT_146078 [Aspergillus coremiiformis]